MGSPQFGSFLWYLECFLLLSDDYKSMMGLQDKLNSATKPKRDRSFNAEKPRKAALKCKEMVLKSTTSKSRSTQNQKSDSTNNPNAPSSSKSANGKSNTTADKKVSSFYDMMFCGQTSFAIFNVIVKIHSVMNQSSVLGKLLHDVKKKRRSHSSSSSAEDSSTDEDKVSNPFLFVTIFIYLFIYNGLFLFRIQILGKQAPARRHQQSLM